ncbi:MAG: phage tail protein [Pseudonocardiaceae bacterium]
MADPTKDPAVSVCFAVELDSNKLGFFNSCEGLGMEVVIEQHEEGGNNGFAWQLATRTKFPNIKLSRPLTKDTEKVTKWFTEAVQKGTGTRSAQGRQTGVIKAMTLDGTVIASWSLLDVVPVRWTGPSLNPDSPKVATETIEIAHHGFGPPASQN